MNNNNRKPVQSRILYKSEACIVINKCGGEAVEGLASKPAQERMSDPRRELAAMPDMNTGIIEAVNRLDVPVTGCALFALTKPALSFLGRAFSDAGSVKKIYWAIVEKPPHAIPESGELVHWIETKSSLNKSFAHNESGPGRKKAALRYRISGEGENYLFTEIELFSGRHHQIRAQFARAGLHIRGDLKYGAKRSEKNGGIRLHARFLAFPDPLNRNGTISVTADPPQMDNLWQAFLDKCAECQRLNQNNTY